MFRKNYSKSVNKEQKSDKLGNAVLNANAVCSVCSIRKDKFVIAE